MKISSPQGMTLRQKLMEADKLTRELVDHLERNFLPKVHDLRRVTRQGSDSEQEKVRDLTIRSTSDQMLDSAAFSTELMQGLDQFLVSIDQELSRTH